ncbi:MAG TPA: 30S ribosomal protein S2 [Deltaproteobacteria bacterium]|nr:30S ribosomal protein S2 [Deltaproteobacteria bacterium]
MAYLTMKQLLEAGVHFGHQTKRWNPKMKQYIFTSRNGIYIVDLQQTVRMFKDAYDFVKDVTSRGGKVLFVGTKKQAQAPVQEEASRCGMCYVNQRWLGGLLTNFSTVRKSIRRLRTLTEMKEKGEYEGYTKREALKLDRERMKLEKNLGGIGTMEELPDAVFVIDTKKESIAIREARKLGIPVVGIVDTNCDPDLVDYIIPGNDDAIRAIRLFSAAIANACIEGTRIYEEKLQASKDKEAAEAEGAGEAPSGASAAEGGAAPQGDAAKVAAAQAR